MSESENWVKARLQCSPFEVFTRLRAGVEEDVKAMSASLGEIAFYSFRFVSDGSRFRVLRQGLTIAAASVEFRWDNSGITVKVESADPEETRDETRATLTLTEDGECKLNYQGNELELWQFRRRALENFFFNFRQEKTV